MKEILAATCILGALVGVGFLIYKAGYQDGFSEGAEAMVDYILEQQPEVQTFNFKKSA